MTTFITVTDLAARLHRSPRTIQRWARERRIPHVKLGRATLFTEEQVAEIVRAYSREPQAEVLEHTLPNPAYVPRPPIAQEIKWVQRRIARCHDLRIDIVEHRGHTPAWAVDAIGSASAHLLAAADALQEAINTLQEKA